MMEDAIEVASQIEVPPKILNYSELDSETIVQSDQFRTLAGQLTEWVGRGRAVAGQGNLFSRGAYTPPDHPYSEMKSARIALETDDIVAGVAEVTEAFAFQGIKWESEDPDTTDVFNQHAAEVNLDAVVRRMWREEYSYSQFVVAMRWDWREYKVRGRNATDPEDVAPPTVDPATGLPHPAKRAKRPKRRKVYRLWVPVEIRLVDSTKVVPINQGPFGDEVLAWQAAKEEMAQYRQVVDGDVADPLLSTFFVGEAHVTQLERELLGKLGVDPDRLLLMNPDYVARHTITKPDYERFADIRLKSVFRLLDMKRQLLDADRASLIGAANYILLVRKGSKEQPAKPEEISNLQSQYSFLARVPVIIADHRLEIDIIAPKVDMTLDQDKYDVIDTRLLARLLGTLSLGSRGQRNETNVTISHAVARNMENRRHMLRRFLETRIAKTVVEHPKNQNAANKLGEEPNLVYTPRQISLGFDQALAQMMATARDHREVSRDTFLEFLGLDQGTEAMRMEMEAERYDDVFQTQIPFSSPNMPGNQLTPNGTPESPAAAGRRGGRPKGGGSSSNTTDTTPKTPAGNKTTKKGT